MRSLILILSILISLQAYSQQGTRETVVSNLRRYIDPDGSLAGYYSIKDSGLFIYASPADKPKNKYEFFVPWRQTDELRRIFRELPKDSIVALYNKRTIKSSGIKTAEPKKENHIPVPDSQLLKGRKIALDPGHIAGDSVMARLEGKCLFLTDESSGKKEYLKLIEGELTLATAYLVKEKLEAMGAEVMMTRTRGNETAFGSTYEEWLKKEMPEAVLSRSGKLFHDKFKSMELLERARKINEYKPDATLIIHYNVDETNEGWTKPGNKNFTMAFIGGNIKSKNLSGKHNRIEFLRMMITDDLSDSEKLAGALVNNFTEKLKVPVAGMNDAVYLKEESIQTSSKGVYSRNLALTRLVHGPLAYGESLYQDNYKECRELCNCTFDVQGVKTSERVRTVADCYVEAVKEFFSSAK